MNLFDSHAHYNDEKFEADRDEIINKIYQNGVSDMVCAGYSFDSSILAVEISKKYNNMFATCGISPNDINENYISEISKLKEFIVKNKNKIVAIGEIGLDYYWNKENKEEQKDAFIRQIELANTLDLPIVIHTREAVMDTIDVIKNQKKSNNAGVFHCCPLNIELVKEAVKLGYYISFSGNITFKSAKPEAVINYVPLDRILIETDSPYLTPEPYRGTRNNSMNVRFVAEKIAQIRNLSIEDVADITNKNAKKIFKIGISEGQDSI